MEIKKTKYAEFDCLVRTVRKNWRHLSYMDLVHLENIHSTNTTESLLPDMRQPFLKISSKHSKIYQTVFVLLCSCCCLIAKLCPTLLRPHGV